MIRIFIFKGDVQDPFFEFFVKSKKEGDVIKFGVSGQQDYVLDEGNALPNFLFPIEQEIFKTGVTISLLKRVERGIASNKYYSICSL